jgi:ribonuclease PH
MQRANNRKYHELRPLKVMYDIYTNAAGSTLFEIGNTKVLCSVVLQNGVPHFLRGKGSAWLTAEYSMLPASTPIRTIRETTAHKRSGRTIEISRLIGRSLRSVTKLEGLGEYTIFIDCDVLQADGSTRTACVTGAYLALKSAEARWLASGIIRTPIITEELGAVSVGITPQGEFLLDIDYAEDSNINADFNFVLTRSGKIIEMQGTAEVAPISWEDHENVRRLAMQGVANLGTFFDTHQQQSSSSYFKEKALVSSYVSYEE